MEPVFIMQSEVSVKRLFVPINNFLSADKVLSSIPKLLILLLWLVLQPYIVVIRLSLV